VAKSSPNAVIQLINGVSGWPPHALSNPILGGH
jgi:hypothetical protein